MTLECKSLVNAASQYCPMPNKNVATKSHETDDKRC